MAFGAGIGTGGGFGGWHNALPVFLILILLVVGFGMWFPWGAVSAEA